MGLLLSTKDAVFFVGGRGTQAGNASSGGCTKAFWGDIESPSKSLSDVMGANGEPLSNVLARLGNAACDVVNNGSGKVRITKAAQGYFPSCVAGLFAGVDFNATYTDGWYEVLDNDSVNDDWIDIDLAYSAVTTCAATVGGALPSLQSALDLADAALVNVYVLDNKAETISATIDADICTGNASAGTRVIVKAANSSGVVDGTRIIITTASDLTNGLLSFMSTSDFTQWWHIDFDAGGAGKADYCVYNAADQTASSYHSFYDCIFRRALDETAVFIESGGWKLLNCEIHSSGDGLWTDGAILIQGCSIHDNTGSGITTDAANAMILGCKVYDNTGYGIYSKSVLFFFIGNTIFGNGNHGLYSQAGSDEGTIFNNTSCGNGTEGTGYGYYFAGQDNVLFFAYNHSCDNEAVAAKNNADGHCNLMTDPTSDSEWDDLFQGNNQHGDPKFTNIADGSEDFLPTTGSPLIDKALDTDDELDIGAVQSAGGGGGGLLTHPGMSGGMRG